LRSGDLLCDDIGLVDGSLDYLLFFRVQVLCEVLIQLELFLLEP
jgi:hypothetical protein